MDLQFQFPKSWDDAKKPNPEFSDLQIPKFTIEHGKHQMY